MLAGTGRANVRLAEIEAGLDRAARQNVLAPITLRSPGRGAFDPATVKVTWLQKG